MKNIKNNSNYLLSIAVIFTLAFLFLAIILSPILLTASGAVNTELTNDLGTWDGVPVFWGYTASQSTDFENITDLHSDTDFWLYDNNQTNVALSGVYDIEINHSVVTVEDTKVHYSSNTTYYNYGTYTSWIPAYYIGTDDDTGICYEFDLYYFNTSITAGATTIIRYYPYGMTPGAAGAFTSNSSDFGHMSVTFNTNGSIVFVQSEAPTTVGWITGGCDEGLYHLAFGRHWNVVTGLEVYVYLIHSNGSAYFFTSRDSSMVLNPSTLGEAMVLFTGNVKTGNVYKDYIDNLYCYDVEISSGDVLNGTSSFSKMFDNLMPLIVLGIGMSLISGILAVRKR